MPTSILGGINQEATQLELLGNITLLLSAMLEKMPRITSNDQIASSIETMPSVALAPNQDLRHITGAVADITRIGTRSAMTTADSMINAGSAHVYNNIIIS